MFYGILKPPFLNQLYCCISACRIFCFALLDENPYRIRVSQVNFSLFLKNHPLFKEVKSKNSACRFAPRQPLTP